MLFFPKQKIIFFSMLFFAFIFLLLIPETVLGVSQCYNQISGINRHEYCRIDNGTSLIINAEGCFYACRVITNNSGEDIFVPTKTCVPNVGYGEWDEFLNHLPEGVTQNSCVIAPVVTTLNATNITANSAILSGKIDNLGGDDFVKVRFVYGTNQNILNLVTPEITKESTGNFSQIITNLSANTIYYFYVQASNSAGVGRGNILNFTTKICNPGEIEACSKDCYYNYCWNRQCVYGNTTVGGTRVCNDNGTWGNCVANCPSSYCQSNTDCMSAPECFSDRDCGQDRFWCCGSCTGCFVSFTCVSGMCRSHSGTYTCLMDCCPRDCGGHQQPACPC